MPLAAFFAVLLVGGLLLLAASALALRAGGARVATGRRLGGPPEIKVGHLLDLGALPSRPVRVAGRIRCTHPLDAGDGELLVAFHRDVEVRIGGAWRTVERLRETRSFDLWDHDGSLPLDPARAAEPLIAIPTVWRGDPDELEEPHASAAARLAERHGAATGARAVTRSINVTDRLLVLAQPVRDEARGVRLEPPPGGFLMTNLALADAMRLLGGRRRRLVVTAIAGAAIGVALAAIGLVGLLAAVLLGG